MLARAACFAVLVTIPSFASSGLSGPAATVEQEYVSLQTQMEAARTEGLGKYTALSYQVLDRESLVHPTDHDPLDIVLRRTRALLNHLLRDPRTPDLSRLDARLRLLEDRSREGGVGKAGALASAARREIFAEAVAVRRAVAFSNPLLDFTDIVFVKKYDAGYWHMCDQYFGKHAKKGGGIFLLKNAFTAAPTLVDVVANATVANGPMAGQSLAGGAFIAPDLSFDGKRIVFGWTKAEGGGWSETSCYHIFSVNTDGTDLRQLTSGATNDFDPIFLPGGRLAFISERRGGFGRCHGRPVPTYTIHSMKTDGSDLYPISYHETNEWHPSVTTDGKLAYTRWDYVDRDSDIAHHIWLCGADGTDPRSPHGNYPHPLTRIGDVPWYVNTNGDGRRKRPWMEMNIRSIPGSTTTFIATAAPHHGQAYGTLVGIDVSIEDDNLRSQLTRITPEVRFPESESVDANSGCYATAWPLSEDYYLCSYTPENADGGDAIKPMGLGLYLIDRFGNREQIYRDAGIHSLDPIPFRSRPVPPVGKTATWQGERAKEPGRPKALLSITNIYESDMPWPDSTRIMALRILQLIPKSTPNVDNPRIGYGNQQIGRIVLGRVPVEDDGSVYCEAPVGKAIFFQALDSNGMAVQSMRSVTYAHEGEHLTCTGCHESKWKVPGPRTAKALGRAPSRLEPEVDVEGASVIPINFHRLARPVFESKCLPCHTKEGTGPQAMGYGDVKQYAFYFHGGGNGAINNANQGGSRTIPGYFGARHSRMGKALLAHRDKGRITDDEFTRVVLWLDGNSNEFVTYKHQDEERLGKLVWPDLDVDPANPRGTESFDSSPPSQAPAGLAATAFSESRIDLAWNAVPPTADPETGIGGYAIFRDGERVATVSAASASIDGLLENQLYRFAVAAINTEGLAGPLSAAVSATTKADATGPLVLSAAALGTNRVQVLFSEPLDPTTAQTPGNYVVTPGVLVSAAVLGPDEQTVTLTSTAFVEGTDYTLTVSAVSDKSAARNPVAPGAHAAFTFAGDLEITNLTVASGKSYQVVSGLEAGMTTYIDRTYTYSTVPIQYQGALFIMTANDDKTASGSPFLSFTVNMPVTVYIGVDVRATPPGWLQDFAYTDDFVATTDVSLALYTRDFPAGTVTLGPNSGSGMYTVIVKPSEGTSRNTVVRASSPPTAGVALRNGSVHVNVPAGMAAVVQVLSANGRVLRTHSLPRGGNLSIGARQVPSGLYLVRLVSAGGTKLLTVPMF